MTRTTDDPVAVLLDDAPITEIDEAITLALATPELDPRIRSAFIDALLDKRNRARPAVTLPIKEPACP